MWVDPHLALDTLSSLAVIAILAWSYGLVRHHGPRRRLAPFVFGLAFGLVALLQMHAPFQPVAGLLIDMRLVPVALAGAFLGSSGLAACLVVALVTRWEIGGVGMVPGMLGILLAGLAGLAWDKATRGKEARGAAALGTLALATSVAYLPCLFLPASLAQWFLSSAMPVLFPLHLVSVLMLAGLLERVRLLAQADDPMTSVRPVTDPPLPIAARETPPRPQGKGPRRRRGVTSPPGGSHVTLFARTARLMKRQVR